MSLECEIDIGAGLIRSLGRIIGSYIGSAYVRQTQILGGVWSAMIGPDSQLYVRDGTHLTALADNSCASLRLASRHLIETGQNTVTMRSYVPGFPKNRR